MPSPDTPMLRFAPIAHPHALNVRSGVAMAAKPCLGAAGCGLESKLHSDMALQEIRMQRFGPAEHPHAHKTCAPGSRPAQILAYESPAVPDGSEIAGNFVVPACEPGPRHVPENRLRRRSGLQAAIRRKAKVRRQADDATEPKHQITNSQTNNQQPTTKRPASQ